MRFFFFSNEGDEPPHVHVRKGASLARVWLAPPGISYAMGFSPADLRRIRYIYDFKSARANPYAKQLKKSVTIRLDEPTIAYFKDMAEELELPYQTLINLYLRDCAAKGRRLSMSWRGAEAADE